MEIANVEYKPGKGSFRPAVQVELAGKDSLLELAVHVEAKLIGMLPDADLTLSPSHRSDYVVRGKRDALVRATVSRGYGTQKAFVEFLMERTEHDSEQVAQDYAAELRDSSTRERMVA